MVDSCGGGRRSPPKLRGGGGVKVAASGDGGKASFASMDFQIGTGEASAGSRRLRADEIGDAMEVHAPDDSVLLHVEGGLHGTVHAVKEVGGPTIDSLSQEDTFMESGEQSFGKDIAQTIRSNIDGIMGDNNNTRSLPGGVGSAGISLASNSGLSRRTQPVCDNAAPNRPGRGGTVEQAGGSRVQGIQVPNAWVRPTVFTLPSRGELGNFVTGEDCVQLDEEAVQATVKEFDTALVGRLFGRKIPYYFLNAELYKQWGKHGPFRIVTISGDCFICFFNTVEARDAILMGGPWIVAGQVLGLDYWSPAFTPKSAAGFVTPVWVRLPGLPMYCWGERNLARIASPLGEPLWMDAATKRLERGHFARICVRMDLAKPLKPGIWVNGPHGSFYQAAEYEGLSSFCFHCGHVGHKEQFCGMKGKGVLTSPSTSGISPAPVADNNSTLNEMEQGPPNSQVVKGKGEVPSQVDEIVQEGADASVPRGIGPWMLVTRKKRQQRIVQPRFSKHQPEPNAGGQFAWQVKEKHKSPMHVEATGGARVTTSWAPNIEEMDRRCDREQGEADHTHILENPPCQDEPTNGGSGGRAATDLSPPGKESSPRRVGRNPKTKQCQGGLMARSRDRLSKAYIKRLVKSLGPVAHGSRQKRKQIKQLVGGDASPRYNQ